MKAQGEHGGGESEHGACGLRAAQGAALDKGGVTEGAAGGAWQRAVGPHLGREGWLWLGLADAEMRRAGWGRSAVVACR
jgi:hypothetical protein